MYQENTSTHKLLELTTSIVSAYLSANPVPATDIEGLIKNVHNILKDKNTELHVPTSAINPNHNAKVENIIKETVKHDYIVCLEDGKKLKMLKRYLKTHYNMTPEQYRKKWGLPVDYPMVAPGYAMKRSHLAKVIGLGTQPNRKAEPARLLA